MAHSLLPYSERQALKTEHFPTLFQCFLYRNHKMITAERASRVLYADVDEVVYHAGLLGLDGFATEKTENDWLKRGYITLIREEEELAIREARLVGRNPAIGYEASNHYFYTQASLYEKVLNCRHLLGELK